VGDFKGKKPRGTTAVIRDEDPKMGVLAVREKVWNKIL
jgi:hypothetical protein